MVLQIAETTPLLDLAGPHVCRERLLGGCFLPTWNQLLDIVHREKNIFFVWVLDFDLGVKEDFYMFIVFTWK